MPSRWKLSNGSNSYILFPNDLCSTYHSLYQENYFSYSPNIVKRILFIICSFKIFCIEGFPDEISILTHKKGEKKSVLPTENIPLRPVDSVNSHTVLAAVRSAAAS